MVILPVASLFAAILTVWLVGQSVYVMYLRATRRILVGSAGNPLLERAARAQGNTAEYLPLAVTLVALAEVQGGDPEFLAGLGAAMLLGRIIHAYSLLVAEPRDGNPLFRVASMLPLTWLPMLILAGYLVYGIVKG